VEDSVRNSLSTSTNNSIQLEDPRNLADMYFVYSTWMDRAISVSKNELGTKNRKGQLNEVESRLPHEYKKTNRRREVFRISVQFTIHNLTSIKSMKRTQQHSSILGGVRY